MDFLQQKKYAIALQEHKDAIKMQSAWRHFWLFFNFFITLDSAITVQSLTRGFLIRASLRLLHQNATIIQAKVRSINGRRIASAKSMVSAILSSGAAFGGKESDAALLIQCVVRGGVGRDLLFLHRRARDIQNTWRCVAPKRALKLFKAAKKIQAYWRCLAQQDAFRRILAARIIQTAWRSNTIRKRYTRYMCSRRIQTSWRANKTRKQYTRYIYSRRIQTSWRANTARKHYTHYISSRRIQAVWRASKSREEYKEYLCSRKIQASWRASKARKAYTEYICSRKIQTSWRAGKARYNYMLMLCSRTIQTVWRASKARKEYTKYLSSRRIQTAWRASKARNLFMLILRARTIQSVWRGSRARLNYRHFISSRKIQTSWRANKARSSYKQYISSRKIQTAWRVSAARSSFRQYISSRRIQTAWRVSKARKNYKQYIAARNIQANWRGSQARLNFHVYLAARAIQAAWRGKRCHSDFSYFKAARTIQTQWRCYNLRQKYLEYLVEVAAAIMIQSAWRSFICYTDFIFTLADVVAVQRLTRGFIARRHYHQRLQEELLREVSASTIQRVLRGYNGRCEAHAKRELLEIAEFNNAAAVSIQTAWRAYDQKHKFWYLLGCAIQLQCLVRGHQVRVRYEACIRGIIIAQSVARCYLARQKVRQIHLIQSLFITTKDEATEDILAAKVIQTWYKHLILSRHRKGAAVKIQSFFRMVKAIVTKEVEKEKYRRRQKKKQKKKVLESADEDAMLDDAWDAVSVSGKTHEAAMKAAGGVMNLVKKDRRDDLPSIVSEHLGLGKSREASASSPVKTKKMTMPRSVVDSITDYYYEKPPEMVVRLARLDDSDTMSEVSGITTPSVFRYPPSRLERMGKVALTEDLDLEEAWVDMEIQNVKQKKSEMDMYTIQQKRKTMAKGRAHASGRAFSSIGSLTSSKGSAPRPRPRLLSASGKKN